MREILFRGKRIDNGEWVVGCYAYHKIPLSEDLQHMIIVDGFKPYEVDPETIGQCTGMMDKNVLKIFDGDIIKSSRGYSAIVEWTDDGRFLGRTADRSIVYVGQEPAVEIIGNRWDSPEMLTA